MIKYKKQKYNDIRTPIPEDVFVNLVRETLHVNNIDTDDETARKILISLLTSMAYYVYNNPEHYIELSKMVIYRDIELNNLLVIESKGQSAEDIMDYYQKGGMYSEELVRLVKDFVRGIISYSTKKQAEVNVELSKIKEAQREQNNSIKEK